MTRNASSSINSNFGVTHSISKPMRGKTFYNGFQPLVTVQESSPAALKKTATMKRAKDKEGYQTVGAGNRNYHDSFVLQASGQSSMKSPAFKSINFKYPENLNAIKISGEEPV